MLIYEKTIIYLSGEHEKAAIFLCARANCTREIMRRKDAQKGCAKRMRRKDAQKGCAERMRRKDAQCNTKELP